jgi:hypothetical protein
MSFTLSYTAKVALALELIDNMMDLSYFGYENNRLLYNLAGSIVWVTIVQFIFENDFFSWLVVFSLFIFRTTFIISKKKFLDEQNKDSDKK